MPDLPRHLKQLEQELLALGEEATLLEVLDGFIAGLLVCPELIPPSEWLRWVWDSEGGNEPAFDSLSHLNKIIGLVMQHYNGTARLLAERPDHYGPLFAIDPRNDDVLWELWIEGFETAYKLRPAAWQKCLTADPETAQAMSGLLRLIDAVQPNRRLSDEQYSALCATAPDDIALWTVMLNDWRLANEDPANLPPAFYAPQAAKVGRNEPCPCGSGKKYKKCCAIN
jgi:uncharacterized protein